MEMFIQGARRSDGNLNGNDENGKKITLLSIKCIQMKKKETPAKCYFFVIKKFRQI